VVSDSISSNIASKSMVAYSVEVEVDPGEPFLVVVGAAKTPAGGRHGCAGGATGIGAGGGVAGIGGGWKGASTGAGVVTTGGGGTKIGALNGVATATGAAVVGG